MEGRRSGTEGEKLAANYIKSQFKSIGLTPFTPRYYQSFSIPAAQDSIEDESGSCKLDRVSHYFSQWRIVTNGPIWEGQEWKKNLFYSIKQRNFSSIGVVDGFCG